MAAPRLEHELARFRDNAMSQRLPDVGALDERRNAVETKARRKVPDQTLLYVVSLRLGKILIRELELTLPLTGL